MADVRDMGDVAWSIVTGDGSQLENLDMTEDEWAVMGRSMFGSEYREHCEVTMRFDDWIALLALARTEDKRRIS